MAYYPPESLDVTWSARNKSWRRLPLKRRDEVLDLPLRFRNLSIDRLDGFEDEQQEAAEVVREWCARWGAYPQTGLPVDYDAEDFRGKGLLLHGSPGTGKTMMASIAAQYVSDLGWSSRFIRAQDYYAYSRLPMSVKDEAEEERLQAGFDCYEAGWSGWRLVVLDDLGHEYRTGSGWSENLIVNLIRARYSDGAPTIVTTNLDPEGKQFLKRYGEALADYIHEAFWIVTVLGESHRGS